MFKVFLKVFFLPLYKKRYNNLVGTKETIFWNRHGLRDFKFFLLGELGTCLQNLIPTTLCINNFDALHLVILAQGRVGGWLATYFPALISKY